jgi:molybdate transport system ATP-binding protein
VRILVTHDPVEAMTLGDRIVVLEDGKVSQEGTVEELRRAPRTAYVAELVGVNVFRGPIREDDGAWRIDAPEGRVFVAAPGLPGGTVAIGVLAPAEVELHLERPPEGSAQNVVEGTVESIAVDGQRARVRVAGRPPVVAEITLSSADRLALRPGLPVWASFKAVGIDIEPV